MENKYSDRHKKQPRDDLPSVHEIKNTDSSTKAESREQNTRAIVAGWAAAVAVPLLLWLIWRFVPMPGTLIAALAVCGSFGGLLLYEHARIEQYVHPRTVTEQLLLVLLLLTSFMLVL